MNVAYQGIGGAYSEAAVYKHFGKDVHAIGYETFEEVFNAVTHKKANAGVIPIENTIAGSVAINYDLLLQEDVAIIAEIFLTIRHNLLSHHNKLEKIKRAYSHPHALAQCKEFLMKHGIKSIQEYDTAGAAEIVERRNDSEEAAIASDLCSEVYHLHIVARDIQTHSNNITRFFVIVPSDLIPPNLKKEKTTIAFNVKHYSGSLVNCLQRLSKYNVNLTKLESRPIPHMSWEYVFFADLEGGINENNVQTALSEMEAACTSIKVLGSYPKSGIE